MPAPLKEISPDKIRRNPDNPRIFFRDEEMDTLGASIWPAPGLVDTRLS
jgi:ParB-like chromosome segregation protein Spo0J